MKRIARLLTVLLAAGVLASPPSWPRAQQDDPSPEETTAQRMTMVEGVRLQARLLGPETGVADLDERVLEAMRQVPRHAFVPPELAAAAYLDLPLPVMPGATVSQPYIVALMLHLAAPAAGGEALVVGVGGGYLTALLVEMQASVRAMEYEQEIERHARGVFERLGYEGIELRRGDGYYGWPERERRFDSIVVRLAIPEVPPSLTAQLAPGGRLVAPVGRPEGQQWLTVVERDQAGQLRERRVLPVRFTPLPGGIRL